ncbi:Uncharacterised protein [Mycobacteroides abscessus subsp. abscessus]|nr:Uncharacterised protein [Mycobacteroides abscessus subsp. abscessus]
MGGLPAMRSSRRAGMTVCIGPLPNNASCTAISLHTAT